MSGAEDAPPIPRGPLTFILLTVLMDVIGFGLIIPVLPTLVSDLGGVDLSNAATIGGWLLMSYALAQFIFSPILGGLSDAYGRRPVLLMSMGGFSLNMLLMAIAPYLWVLFLGRILAGITGASIATANAYIADITHPSRRAQTYGLLGVAFGIGFALGPAIGGTIGAIHPRWPFVFAACLALCNMAIGYFLLPESLPVEKRRPFDWKRSNIIGSFAKLSKLGGSLRRFAIVYFFWMLASQSLHGIWGYVAAYRYGWTPFGIGISMTFVGFLAIVVNGLLVRRSVRALGEWKTAIAGISFGAAAYLMHFFASTEELAFAALFLGALGGLTVPALQAMMTTQAQSNAQGELQGALSTISSMTVIMGPPIFAYLFSQFSGVHAILDAPGTPFILSVVLTISALALMLLCRQPHVKSVQ